MTSTFERLLDPRRTGIRPMTCAQNRAVGTVSDAIPQTRLHRQSKRSGRSDFVSTDWREAKHGYASPFRIIVSKRPETFWARDRVDRFVMSHVNHERPSRHTNVVPQTPVLHQKARSAVA